MKNNTSDSSLLSWVRARRASLSGNVVTFHRATTPQGNPAVTCIYSPARMHWRCNGGSFDLVSRSPFRFA